MDISARITAWASDEIRSLWEQMREVDDHVDVGRLQLQFRSGQVEYVQMEPFSPEQIQRLKSIIDDATQLAHRRRQAVIEAIRKELVGAEPLR
jgi:hypothetical protein